MATDPEALPVHGPEPERDRLLRALVAVARAGWSRRSTIEPQPGDLVVEVTHFRTDPDAIGYLVGHDDAAYAEDGTGPMREVWDLRPLRGLRGEEAERGYQRWENARFVVVELVGAVDRNAVAAIAEPPVASSTPPTAEEATP